MSRLGQVETLSLSLALLLSACATTPPRQPSQPEVVSAAEPFMWCTHNQAIALDDKVSSAESIAKAAIDDCRAHRETTIEQLDLLRGPDGFVDRSLAQIDQDAFKNAVIDVLQHRQSS
jgi:hypothetical protein